MKKTFIVLITIAIAVALVIVSYCYIQLKWVDTRYAKSFARVLGSKDIALVDEYFDMDTIIICKGKKGSYSDLRVNILDSYLQKKFKLSNDGSYGNGNDKFINNIQELNIEVYVQEDFLGKHRGDILVVMEIERKGINSYRVKSVKVEDEFFEELFFGANT